jgi:hypothetical protein
MPFIVLLFFSRKAGISPEDFKAHFEKNHIPLIQSLAGNAFPVKHTRMYITREADANGDYPAQVIMGKQEDFDYDAIAQMEFEDAAAFYSFIGSRKDKDILRALEEDDEKFSDPTKTKAVVLGEICVTMRGN